MDMIPELHEMCETLGHALKKANEKIRTSGGELSTSDMDYVNKLTHAMKSIKTTIAMMEAEEMDDGGSYGSYGMRGYPRDGGSYMWNGGGYSRMPDSSYARGRGRYANRDSMGRYSSRGYSRDDGYSREGGYSGHGEMVDELRGLMNQAPDEQTRQEFQRMIQRMEQH